MLKQLTQHVRKVHPTFGYTTPADSVLYAALEDTKFTPDISALEQYEWQLFFAPDETKKDHLKHSLLGDDPKYKFPAFTQQNYQFWQSNAPFLPPIPMTPAAPENFLPYFPPIAKIKGEVYAIRPQQFLELDRYKQNTVEYQRQRVRLVVPYRKVLWLKDHNVDHDFTGEALDHRLNNGKEDVKGAMNTITSKYTGRSVKTSEEYVAIIRAWMYIGRPTFWDPLISAYDYSSVEVFNAKNRRWLEQYYSIRRPPLPPK